MNLIVKGRGEDKNTEVIKNLINYLQYETHDGKNHYVYYVSDNIQIACYLLKYALEESEIPYKNNSCHEFIIDKRVRVRVQSFDSFNRYGGGVETVGLQGIKDHHEYFIDNVNVLLENIVGSKFHVNCFHINTMAIEDTKVTEIILRKNELQRQIDELDKQLKEYNNG